jgi:predicted O-methyltransferase YrrM
MAPPVDPLSVSERVDRLDLTLFAQIAPVRCSCEDRRSLLALHAALAARGNFGYLEVGSYLGASLQTFIADPRCRTIVSVDRRDAVTSEGRSQAREYPANTTAHMLERLSAVPGADLEKLTTVDAGTEELDPAGLSADLCFIDAEHTNAAALRDGRFCHRVIRNRGVIGFHQRTRILHGLWQFLGRLSHYRAYPLAHDLFVVEINIPTLLSDRRVRSQVPRAAWLIADRLHAVRPVLRLLGTPPAVRDRVAEASGVQSVQKAGRSVGYVRSRWPRPLGTRPPHRLAVCAVFRDEAPYLAEWVTFHRLQGVERFWLYDNLSSDDWRAELEPELRSEVVTVTPWPQKARAQLPAFAHCLKRHRADARWLAFLDIDEFLFSPTGLVLPEVLRHFDTHAGVVVNWRMYGTNGHEQPPAGLVIENYLWRGTDDHVDNSSTKCIVYPRYTVGPGNCPHLFRHRGVAVGEDGREVRRPRREPPTVDLLRINHYYSKSASEYRRKLARPTAWDGNIRETSVLPPDAVRDDVILQFVPRLKAALARRTPRERGGLGAE